MKMKESKNRREEYEDRKKVTKKTKKEHKRKGQRREERKEKEKKTGPRSKVCLPLLLLKLPLPPCVLDLLLLAASAAAACCWWCCCSLLLRLVLLMHAQGWCCCCLLVVVLQLAAAAAAACSECYLSVPVCCECHLRVPAPVTFLSPSFCLHILLSCSSSPSSSLASCVALHTQNRQKNSNTTLNQTEQTQNEIAQL